LYCPQYRIGGVIEVLVGANTLGRKERLETIVFVFKNVMVFSDLAFTEIKKVLLHYTPIALVAAGHGCHHCCHYHCRDAEDAPGVADVQDVVGVPGVHQPEEV
jgi:hypothetical protein